MLFHIFSLLVCMCLLTACAAPAAAPTAMPLPSTTLPPTTAPTGTATAAPTVTAIPPTLTPTVPPATATFTPTPVSPLSLARGNVLWIFFEEKREYHVFDIQSKAIHVFLDVPRGCEPKLLSASTKVFCNSESQFYLYDLYTKQSEPILENRVIPVKYFWKTKSMLAYTIPNTDPSVGSVYLYNLETQTETLFAENVDISSNYLKFPIPSPDGKYIVFHQGDRFTALHKSGELTRISPEDQVIEQFSSFVWAPVGPLFAYGTIDKESDSGNDPVDHIYVANLETGKTWRLEPGDGRFSPGWPEWSPDGKKIATILSRREGGKDLCIFSVETAQEETCIPIVNTEYTEPRVSLQVWSPDGQQIAFDVGPSNEDGPEYVMILDLETREFITLANANSKDLAGLQYIDGLLWR